MSCIVRIPSPLRSYTAGAATVAADGGTVAEVLASLEQRFAGIRFRMLDEQSRLRQHIRLYVNTAEVQDLSQPVGTRDVVHVICALSGG
ncbi:MAG TPA: MoaD/ThiS family protein [Steroidobacteraceae bacterium]|jgi:molybdopterin converting factor small subunit